MGSRPCDNPGVVSRIAQDLSGPCEVQRNDCGTQAPPVQMCATRESAVSRVHNFETFRWDHLSGLRTDGLSRIRAGFD